MTNRKRHNGFHVAIIGASSLKGKEVREVLEESTFPLKKLSLVDDDEAVGQLTEFEGEPTFIQSITPETFSESDLVFFASTTPVFTRRHWPQAAAGRAALVDLSHALLDVPQARIRVPFLEQKLGEVGAVSQPWFVVPHAAAIVLLTVLVRAADRLPLRQMVANVFEPASERGASGISELQEQSVRLFSFKEFPRAVFDAQVAFNLLSRYGPESPAQLEEIEETIRREVERCAPSLADCLAVRVLQVPVFHAHALSIFIELEEPVEVSSIEQTLRGDRVSVLKLEETPATPVGVASGEDIVIGPVVRDRKRAHCFWLWVVTDNLRLTARTAVDIAETLAL